MGKALRGQGAAVKGCLLYTSMLIYYSKRGRPLQGEKRKSREKEEKMFHVKQTAEKEPRMFHVKHPQPVTAKDGSPRAAAASAEHRRNREEYLR